MVCTFKYLAFQLLTAQPSGDSLVSVFPLITSDSVDSVIIIIWTLKKSFHQQKQSCFTGSLTFSRQPMVSWLPDRLFPWSALCFLWRPGEPRGPRLPAARPPWWASVRPGRCERRWIAAWAFVRTSLSLSPERVAALGLPLQRRPFQSRSVEVKMTLRSAST